MIGISFYSESVYMGDDVGNSVQHIEMPNDALLEGLA